MKWLIVEDSLKGRRGHWFEYISGFCAELPKLGDQVTLLVTAGAEDFIIKGLAAHAILPDSPYLKMSDGATAWRRYVRIPIHAWKTFRVLSKYLKEVPAPDLIFVPTVIIHHLLGWFLLIKLGRVPQRSRVLLFFPSLPLRVDGDAVTRASGISSMVMALLLNRLKKQVERGKVILGVETLAMKKAGEKSFGIAFSYFPHPVEPLPTMVDASRGPGNDHLTMACYGPARSEKGSDILTKAIAQYLEKNPESRVQFAIQWIDDFHDPDGELITLPPSMRNHPRVEVVSQFFKDGEYAKRLASTSVLLLPYRRSSYALRLSRVVIEAMVNGIPVVVTRGTTLEEQANEFGGFITCKNESVESLLNSIEKMVGSYDVINVRGRMNQGFACDHFSVAGFRESLEKK
jgi:glycosyltransferase involved in cell wall biosynthesis